MLSRRASDVLKRRKPFFVFAILPIQANYANYAIASCELLTKQIELDQCERSHAAGFPISKGTYMSAPVVSRVVLMSFAALATTSYAAAAITCDAFNGAVLVKDKAGVWTTIAAGGKIEPGNLIVALPKATFTSENGAIEMQLLADVAKRGPYPVLESAVMLNKSPQADLDVYFDRGIVVFVNKKKAGSATVALRFREQVWNLVLKNPGTRVGLEIYSRHMPGMPKINDGKVEAPVTYLVMLAADGEVFLDTSHADFTLHAPPGPARLRWDSVSAVPTVDRLEQLPEGITRAPTKEETQLLHEICACAGKLKDRAAGPVLDQFLASESKVDRLVGVTGMGAIDDLPRLANALTNPKHADVRRQAIVVLRHWMGRGPGQVELLYKSLKESSKLSDVQARTILQLLFGFSTQDRFEPATFDLLTAFLEHPQIAVRELAHWHLIRLMPEGNNIAFDAGAAEKPRQQAVQAWRELIFKHHK